MPDTPPIKLVYIAGYGRSGSTLLDIALGQHDNIFGSGEISPLTRHVWANDEYCACGRTVSACPLWSAVMRDWDPDLPSYLADQKKVESILANRGRSGRFAASTLKLLRTIQQRSGKEILVDSSKLPGRGFALKKVAGVDLHLVHLVRDPRAVVWSMMKPMKRKVEAGLQKDLRPKPLLYTALRWLVVNLAAENLARRLGSNRAIRVRYEDFVADPSTALQQIMALLGEEANRLPDGVSSALHPDHQVAGSRHRMQKELRIKMDERWQSEMPAYRQRLVSLLCAPLLRRYGYPWKRTVAPRIREALAS